MGAGYWVVEKLSLPGFLGEGSDLRPDQTLLNKLCVCVCVCTSFCVPEKTPRVVDLGQEIKTGQALVEGVFFYLFALCDFMNNAVT